MEEEKTLLVQCLGNSPKLRIIDFLIDNRPFDYSKKEIIEGSGTGKVTFFKVWKELVEFGIVQQTRKYGKAILFKLNEENEIVKKLLVLEYSLIKQTMNKAVTESEVKNPQKVRVQNVDF
jgi:hypothetical protein